MNALPAFMEWLPGELEYSAKKAPYARKLVRAKLPIEDPQSVVSFLSNEWHHAQFLKRRGKLHSRNHEKTAQLQYAKFAAGIFDKVALIYWIANNKPKDDTAVDMITALCTKRSLSILRHPTSLFYNSSGLLNGVDPDLPYDFAFGGDLNSLQKSINDFDNDKSNRSPEILITTTLSLGIRATAAYLNFADANLSPDQYFLAPSSLEA
jgi:hypothetical protein